MALVGVQQLATALGRSKGTISKHAASGKIPVADRDERGNPLFDVEQVRKVYEAAINPLMRRRGGEVSASAADEPEPEPRYENEVDRASAAPARETSGLQKQLVMERQLRNRRLLRQLGIDEGLFVLKAVVDNDVMTLARQTRDGVAAQMADFAAKLYAFVAQPRSEAELRIWLSEHTGAAFDEVEKAIAAEKGDEFDGSGPADGQPGEVHSSATA